MVLHEGVLHRGAHLGAVRLGALDEVRVERDDLLPRLPVDPRPRGALHRGDDGGDGAEHEGDLGRLLPLQRDVPVQLLAVDGVHQDLLEPLQQRSYGQLVGEARLQEGVLGGSLGGRRTGLVPQEREVEQGLETYL